MKQPTMLAVLAAATATFLVAGCGNEQTNQASSLSPREEALKTYLEIQKAVADGDFNQFKNYLGPDFTAAANSGALTPEFQRLTVKYGGSLTKFFSGSAEFALDDEEGRPIRIDEMFQYKNGLVQKWPGKDLLNRVDEICAIGAELDNDNTTEEKIKALEEKMGLPSFLWKVPSSVAFIAQPRFSRSLDACRVSRRRKGWTCGSCQSF